MARLVFPPDFGSQKTLAGLIYERHVADGAASVLNTYLSYHSIDLAALVNDSNAASTLENNRAALRRQSEDHREKRDLAFLPAWKITKDAIAYLKSLYNPHFRVLGNWGVDVNGKNRVAYPRKFKARKELIINFFQKHNSYAPGTSPLHSFLNERGIDVAALLTQVAAAAVSNDAMNTTARQAENARQQRDNIWKPRAAEVRGIGSFLMSLFFDNPHHAGTWGFTVDSSPRQPVLRKSKLLLQQSRTIKGAVIGSTFQNTGTTVLQLRKGTKSSQAVVTVQPGEGFELTKGWSMFTITNTSTLETGSFSTSRFPTN